MSKLLEALLGGVSFKESLEASGKAIMAVANTKHGKFKTTNKNGYRTTELYPFLSKNPQN